MPESDPRPGPSGDQPVVDAPQFEGLLQRGIDLVAGARPMPLSTSSMINKEDILEVLEDAQRRVPDELRAARWLLKEREEFLAKVRREGDDILESARDRAARMVERTEVVKASETRARHIVEQAESQARMMQHEVEDYCDQKLGGFEAVLDRTMMQVREGRTRLNRTALDAEADEREAAEALPDVDASGFFDQDA